MAVRERTETKLLDAADELLFTHGVAATPVDAILARAGVSPATLYRAYGSKDGLVAAALDRRHRVWLEVWDAAVARAADDRARLLAVLDALDAFRARPDGARWCAFLGTAAEHADPVPAVAAALGRETDALRARLTELAVPVAGERAALLAEELMLVVTGELGMRLRGGSPPGVARAVAAVLVDRPPTPSR
ncbi:TetR/AcrR family transcriptional regulator [Nocardioides dongxiaopingii]|uniref:TetR/AcrR family transcriptional regulator n=1 Tax=Nocardioides sp. S-1144 TaxID=2582905 RepID=UPI0011649ADB|nr:TetR/AcrR family transcriptional regulator [Nocardioides sp. S-1144]QDH11085.1 TetR/AcrR family transcriptional regulator [Nocardioides sp. S-1144]